MPLFTTGSTPGKIENTNTITHIAPTLTYLEKEPVTVTDFSFPFTCGYFLSATVLILLREVLLSYIMLLCLIRYL